MLLLVSGVLMYGTFWGLKKMAQQDATGHTEFSNVTLVPPEPHLQTNELSDLSEKLEDERYLLNHYGWVNHQQGIAHIPIERAMALVLEKGLPTR